MRIEKDLIKGGGRAAFGLSYRLLERVFKGCRGRSCGRDKMNRAEDLHVNEAFDPEEAIVRYVNHIAAKKPSSSKSTVSFRQCRRIP